MYTLNRLSVDLSTIKPHFDSLQLDPYLPDNNYRYRAVTRFKIKGDNEIEVLPSEPLFQAQSYNPIQGFGGIKRYYSDVPAAMIEDENFRKALRIFVDTIPEKISTFSCHMIRTSLPGMPAPEGVHRDGVEYQAIFVINRKNVKGDSGVTQVFNNDMQAIFENVLNEGDMLLFDDRITYHDTSKVVKADDDMPGYRDVFILSNPDHAYYVPK